MVNLTNKEKFLLEGEKYQHQLAIDKYNNYVAQSQDSILKNLFSNLVKIEEKHLSIINEMLKGQVPQINTESIHPYYENSSINSNDLFNIGNIILSSINTNHYEDGDKIICFDALTTEELLYSTSSSASLEFKNTEFEDALKYIINEKSENIKYISTYMSKRGMYNNTIYF